MIKKLIPLMLVLALALAGCGSKGSNSSAGSNSGAGASSAQSSSSSSASPSAGSTTSTETTHFAKTKFIFHAGLAFGAFHHFIYKPFKAGELAHPTQNKLAFAKALLAGAFVIHEVRIALHDAKSSKILSKVVLPLTAMGAAVQSARAALTHHQVNAAALNGANSDAASASRASNAAGQPIQETTVGSGISG